MPYVQIPKDLNTIKEKVALGLTKRQLICFPLGIAVGLIAFFATRNINTELAVVLLIMLSMPGMFVAMYEKNGFHLEKIIKHYFRANFQRSKIRVYKTENMYDLLDKQITIDKELNLIGEKNNCYTRAKKAKKSNNKQRRQ